MSRWFFCSFAILALLQLVVAPAANGQPGVSVVRDVAYREGSKLSGYERERCRMDLYLPPTTNAAARFPVLVWFHGGNLTGGNKQSESEAMALAAQGLAVVQPNYRLYPKVKFPAYIEDAAAAVAWVVKNIEKHGGDKGRVFVGGHSAGGYLTAMVGMDPGYLKPHALSPRDLAGLIPIAGQMVTHSTVREQRGIAETTPVIDAAAPLFHVRGDAPPLVAVVGLKDTETRIAENRYFVAALRMAGHKNSEFIGVPGRDHSGIVGGLANPIDPVARILLDFTRAKAPTGPVAASVLGLAEEIRAHRAGVGVWWIGNGGWILKGAGIVVGIDLDLKEGNPRGSPPVSMDEAAGLVDLVLVTSNRSDHCNPETLNRIAVSGRATFVVPQSCLQSQPLLRIPRRLLKIPHPQFAFVEKGVSIQPIHSVAGGPNHAVAMHEAALLENLRYNCGYVFKLAGKTFLQPGESMLTDEHLGLQGIDAVFVSPTVYATHLERSAILVERLKPTHIFAQQTDMVSLGAVSAAMLQSNLPEAFRAQVHPLERGAGFVVP
jgi:acetyl esterase/lipase/L-ascorbate metabolism protein UlaG (beta-lactamase superfamily)